MKILFIKISMLSIFLFHFSIINAAPQSINTVRFASQNNTGISPKQVIVHFLQWYKINIERAGNFPLLGKDSSDNFQINQTACKQYLNFLKNSQYLSPRYIDNMRTFLTKQAKNLKKNPNQSDIPEGFDLDFVLATQEPELILYHINQTIFKTYSLTETAAVIGLSWPVEDGMKYKVSMHKNKQGWQIDSIATEDDK